jgi:hypothetical protein
VLVPQKAEAVIRLPSSLGLRASAELKQAVTRLVGNPAAIAFQ